MKVTGKVTETLVVEKEVEVEVSDNATEFQIDQAIRREAYKKIMVADDNDHGWELVDSVETDVKIGEKIK